MKNPRRLPRQTILKLVAGDMVDPEIVLQEGEKLTLGRGQECDYVVHDNRLSRQHLCFSFNQQTRLCSIIDLHSRNGTLVNGRRIQECILKSGDRIKAGRLILEVQYLTRQPDVEDPWDENTEVIQNLIYCEKCGSSVGPIAVQQGLAKRSGECYLCADCSTILEVGSEQFEHYLIYDKLGTGSAGLVYLAFDTKLKVEVALKVLKPGPKVRNKHILRFIGEAQTIATLDHENIVKVYGARQFPGGYYLAIEYFPGDDVKMLLDKLGKFSVELTLRIAYQISKAIGHAALKGVVHRDIKPANILYNRHSGVAKLSDFGLAKRMRSGSRRTLTKEGEGLGTPTYMPPEQMKNARNADPRADIYSLGATMFHCLTGRLPITAKTYREFVDQLMNAAPPSVTELRPEIPPSVSSVIQKCMMKNPNKRYQNAAELTHELQALATGLNISFEGPRPAQS